jgi:hypothetical protein
MARRLRYYGKKRGDRRTGSKTLGSAGEALFFAILLLLGCGVLVALVVFLVVPEWRVNHEFVESRCTVIDKRVGERQGKEGTLYRPEVYIEYRVRGKPYYAWTYDIGDAYSTGREEKETLLERFNRGQQYPCWYDPVDPYVVVLVRGYNWWIWLVFLIPISFMVIGGGGFLYSMLHWGKSAERRAAMVRRAQQRDLLGGNGRSRLEFPNVPDDADITNSPGTRLRFRLPIGSSPGWVLFGMLLACLLWNGTVSVFALGAVRSHLAGEPEWLLTLSVIPFVVVGIGLVGLFIRQLLLTTGIGPTLVEISEHPLHPGGQCRLFVSQWGRLKVNSFEVLLICEESATYRQGTDTRTETREVHRQEIFRREGFQVRHGVPFEAECELAVPAGAMHSFKADHNEIHWKLVVKGDVAGWPDYKRTFPVIIHPPNGRTEA